MGGARAGHGRGRGVDHGRDRGLGAESLNRPGDARDRADVPRHRRRSRRAVSLQSSTGLLRKVAHGRKMQVVVVGSNCICHHVVSGREERDEARRLRG